jgi:hypothetical protein
MTRCSSPHPRGLAEHALAHASEKVDDEVTDHKSPRVVLEQVSHDDQLEKKRRRKSDKQTKIVLKVQHYNCEQ